MEGQQIGSYRIERILGQGGFGVVYIGVDVRLNRRAAIKQLLPELSKNRDIVERFFNEAKAAAGINHLGIVEIYDVGWHTDGSAYFAMKLLDGDSLAKRIRSGPLPVTTAATIARQVAAALAAAHKSAIVHRDLKPDNIILVPDEETMIGERAITLDFGIAKLLGDASINKTSTGMVMGTPLYMSPEQCRGAGAVDHRTDVYALGCILFEMLTGRPPFTGEGAGEILGKHQFVEAPAIRSLREDIPPELAALVTRALAKQPEDRPQLMTDFAAALQPFTGRETRPPPRVTPVEVTPMPVPTTLGASGGQVITPATKRSSILLLAGGVGVAIVALVVALTASSGTPSVADARALAEPPLDGQVESADPESKEVLARAKVTDVAYCKHILIGWAELEKMFHGRMDPRAAKRSQLEAAKLALDALAKIKANPTSIDALINERGDDGAKNPEPYRITEQADFVPEFKSLGLRLAENEAGIVKSAYGYHVMLRVAAPPLDPLESAEILHRPLQTPLAEIQHILIGWKDLPGSPSARALFRDKGRADQLAKQLLDRVKAGEDMAALMKEHSEDRGSAATGAVYTIADDGTMVEGFVTLSLRLAVNEVGIVRTQFGFHIVKRLPDDPIESIDVLARAVAAERPRFKYVQLEFTGANGTKQRSRAGLEKLVDDTMAQAKRGTPFEDLMKTLSDDKASATAGTAYEITTQGVPPLVAMLAKRLAVGEVGAVKAAGAVYVTKRVE